MAMSVGPSAEGNADVMVEMNTTPLIDVMLVLLVMLIITLPIQTHAVKLDMPKGNEPPPEIPPEVIDIYVDFDGSVLWNNNLVATPEDPASYKVLDKYFEDIGKQGAEVQPEIHLAANNLVIYDHVARVLADAQRLGVIKIGLVGGPETAQ